MVSIRKVNRPGFQAACAFCFINHTTSLRRLTIPEKLISRYSQKDFSFNGEKKELMKANINRKNSNCDHRP